MPYDYTPTQAREEWLKDLRSGDFEQGTDYLCVNDTFCCLGVACETMRRCEGEKALRFQEHTDPDCDVTYREYGDDDEAFAAPEDVHAWLGLKSPRGSFRNNDGTLNCLTQLNDGGFSFTEIADIIESQPEGLFEG